MLVNMFHFIDDLAMIAKSEDNLDNMLIKMNDSWKKYIMKINKIKLKILICSKQELTFNIIIGDEKLETV